MGVCERSTERLLLRRVYESDLDAFVALESALRAREVPPRNPPEVASSARYLSDFVDVWERGELGYWTVLLAGNIVGFGGVQPKRWRARRCWNLYFRVVRALWGRGIATEMAREGIAAGRDAHPDWPVLAETRPWNVAAINVAERAGLVRQADDTEDGYVVLFLEPFPTT